MKLSEIKKNLEGLEALHFMLPDGRLVPENFHITEVGIVTKDFIDCGGTVRKETVVNFQLWEDTGDEDHRLKPRKLLNIIALSEKVLGIDDHEVEVEYQDRTIGKYDLGFDGRNFLLLAKQTACLASDQCAKPVENTVLQSAGTNGCTPGGKCC